MPQVAGENPAFGATPMMHTIIAFLTTIFKAFRFIERSRLRAANEAHLLRMERAREREHQLEMMEAVFTRIESSNATTMAALTEMAKGTQEQAKGFTQWLEMFRGSMEAPTSSTVRDSDEWLEEQQRLKAQGFPVDLPVEFQLASILHSMEKEENES